VRTMIQCLLSQFGPGNRKVPVKVAPACNSIVLPHWALFNAPCRSPPAFTLMTDPGAGFPPSNWQRWLSAVARDHRNRWRQWH